ncbi:hypothetical protein niasHS_001099 [Heterodera schachtii]|uniref:Uncharacterized protein n=1 Tax=Heterodera schachtii TaxID=97005 RepID=A0ABD2KC51_HETSC
MDPCEPKLQNEKELDDLKKAIEDKKHEKFKLHLFSTEENPGKEFDKKLYNLMKMAKEEQKKELKALKKEEKSALEPLEKRIFDEKFSVYGDKFGILAQIAYEKLFL